MRIKQSRVQTDQTKPTARRSAFFSDSRIQVRESILNRLAGVAPTSTINSIQRAGHAPTAVHLAAELKQTLDKLKNTFIDESGYHVDYAALRESPAYAAYQQECLASLAQFSPDELTSEEARRAFWINLYNALVLDAVITFGVRRTVTEGWIGILAFFRRAAYSVGGVRVSLEDIEHGILRGNHGHPYLPGRQFASNDRRLDWILPIDPRIHFALNCGSRSCPPVRSYGAGKLDGQLDLASRHFVDVTTGIDRKRDRLSISRIFQWYSVDFGGRQGIVDLLLRYLPDDERRAFLSRERANPRLKYAAYDWQLNVA
jgi:hypothetical protein